MKRILTIQDISCVGKCSLTVALPVISAFGIECSVLPTALLSTHTAFNNFSFLDLTDELTKISDVWKKENITFDGLYSGYLGSIKQLNIVSDIFSQYKNKDNFIIVDPVMGDNGKLYSGFDDEFPKAMKSLCSCADVIVPNMTEASALLNVPYIDYGYSEEYIKDLLVKLTDIGCKVAILTGITFDKNKIGVYGYNKIENKYFSYFDEKFENTFHGTGDVFASCLCGCITKGFSLDKSVKIAVKFTTDSIYKTLQNKKANWYGVDFESAIPDLIKEI